MLLVAGPGSHIHLGRTPGDTHLAGKELERVADLVEAPGGVEASGAEEGLVADLVEEGEQDQGRLVHLVQP